MDYSRVLLGLLATLALPSLAHARNVYLNDTEINTLRSQTFEGVNVTIDSQGNVHITSDKYLIHTDAKGASKSPQITETDSKSAATVARSGPKADGVLPGGKYWLVSEENVLGNSQYKLDIFLNGKFIRTIESGKPAVIQDVTSHLVAGKNTVIVRATKAIDERGRRSTSEEHYLRVYIGPGKTGDNNAIFMENPVFEFRRTAAQVDNSAQQMTFEIK